MPPSSISKALRMASIEAVPSTCRSPSERSVPPHEGHIPYGNANPSLTLPQSSQRHDRRAPAQQTYDSSPSMGLWHLGQTRPLYSSVADSAAAASLPDNGFGGTKASAISFVTGHCLPEDR